MLGTQRICGLATPRVSIFGIRMPICILKLKNNEYVKGVQKLLSGSKNKVLEKLNDLEDHEPILQSDVKKTEEKTIDHTPHFSSDRQAVKPAVKSEHREELRNMLEELKSLRSMLRA